MCIFLLYFLLVTLLAVYFILILDYGNNVRQKQIQVIFLFKFKMGRNTVETTCNDNNTFDPGTNKHIVYWWFRKFCKGDESLEDEKCSGQPLEVDNNQFRDIIKADSLTTTEVAQEYNISH